MDKLDNKKTGIQQNGNTTNCVGISHIFVLKNFEEQLFFRLYNIHNVVENIEICYKGKIGKEFEKLEKGVSEEFEIDGFEEGDISISYNFENFIIVKKATVKKNKINDLYTWTPISLEYKGCKGLLVVSYKNQGEEYFFLSTKEETTLGRIEKTGENNEIKVDFPLPHLPYYKDNKEYSLLSRNFGKIIIKDNKFILKREKKDEEEINKEYIYKKGVKEILKFTVDNNCLKIEIIANPYEELPKEDKEVYHNAKKYHYYITKYDSIFESNSCFKEILKKENIKNFRDIEKKLNNLKKIVS